MDVVNLTDKFRRFSDYWSPKIVGEVNDLHVKVVKLKGEFVWHHHEAEDELFLVVAGRLRMKLAPALCERRKPTAEQTGLSAAERRRNLHDAFRVRSPCPGARIAILDDVITTGSTTAALAQAFRDAGAAHVEIWAAARTL